MPQKDDRPIGRTNAVVAGERRLVPWIWEGVVAGGAVTLLAVTLIDQQRRPLSAGIAHAAFCGAAPVSGNFSPFQLHFVAGVSCANCSGTGGSTTTATITT
jgi:hypothetical protein